MHLSMTMKSMMLLSKSKTWTNHHVPGRESTEDRKAPQFDRLVRGGKQRTRGVINMKWNEIRIVFWFTLTTALLAIAVPIVYDVWYNWRVDQLFK